MVQGTALTVRNALVKMILELVQGWIRWAVSLQWVNAAASKFPKLYKAGESLHDDFGQKYHGKYSLALLG